MYSSPSPDESHQSRNSTQHFGNGGTPSGRRAGDNLLGEFSLCLLPGAICGRLRIIGRRGHDEDYMQIALINHSTAGLSTWSSSLSQESRSSA